ncbi:35837_t:CDS:2, partial [Gigaspora margarita]
SKDQDSDPFEHKISIFSEKIMKENLRSYPWEIEKSEMHDRIKKCLEKLNQEEALNINYDEPICSSIIDTENIPEWIRNEFSDKEWNIISDTSGCHYEFNSEKYYEQLEKMDKQIGEILLSLDEKR